MKTKLFFLSFVLLVVLPVVGATDISKTTWIDITKEVAANPINQGGWTVDKAGKVFRSEDSDSIMIEHSEYGKFVVDLKNGAVNKVEKNDPILQKGTSLLNRENGTMLVVRTSEYKFRLRFTEKVAGMKAVEGITGM